MALKSSLLIVIALFLSHFNFAQDLILTGLMHGPISGSPKAVELFVAADIPDLSIYGLGCANNGGGNPGVEYAFPSGTATAGEFIYVVNDAGSFLSFFGFPANFEEGGSACNFNGNDAFVVYESGNAIDIFGDILTPGDGLPWEYTLGWAHREANTGPDGNVFVQENWSFSALNNFSGQTTNAAASEPYPLGDFVLESLLGCTNLNAQNYNPTAVIDDGSCLIFGCIYAVASNFNPLATKDDGSCIIPECCPEDVTGDGIIGTADLLVVLGAFGSVCDGPAPFEFIQAGTGSFVFNGYAPLADKPITVHYHVPVGDVSNMPIVFVHHGNSRDGDEYRDAWISSANSYNFIVISPEFSAADFPGSLYYMTGFVQDEGGAVNPEELWTFSIIEPLFSFVKDDVGNSSASFDMFGHSAGAQFVHRFMLFTSNTSVNRAISANAGWYTVPDVNINFPYGLIESPSGVAEMPTFFGRNLIVHLGQADNDPNDPVLNTSAGANAQGPHRYARGLHFFSESQSICAANALPFLWTKVEVPGVGHDFQVMSVEAAMLLFE